MIWWSLSVTRNTVLPKTISSFEKPLTLLTRYLKVVHVSSFDVAGNVYFSRRGFTTHAADPLGAVLEHHSHNLVVQL